MFHKSFIFFNFFAFLVVVAFTNLVKAKIFNSSYISFEIPEDWNCKQEKTEWLCHKSNISGKSKSKIEAIIILTAKEAAPNVDTIQSYENYLKSNKASIKGSKVERVHNKKISINNDLWVDALQLNSEAPDFYTRYMATVKTALGLGILVTFSAHKKLYTKYNSVFTRAINSLRVTGSKKALSFKSGSSAIGPGNLGTAVGTPSLFSNLDAIDDLDPVDEGADKALMLILLALLVCGIVILFVFKKGKKRRRRSSKRSRRS